MVSAARAPRTGRLDTLAVDGSAQGGRALLTARGELVRGCTRPLTRALAAPPAGVAGVGVDASGVTFLDTAGLAALDTLSEYGRRHRVPVRATGWRGQPRRVLEPAGPDPVDPLSAALPPGFCARTASAVAREHAEQTEQLRLLRLLRLEIGQLRHAMDSRPVIDQARGILMAAHACTPDQAWEIVREASSGPTPSCGTWRRRSRRARRRTARPRRSRCDRLWPPRSTGSVRRSVRQDAPRGSPAVDLLPARRGGPPADTYPDPTVHDALLLPTPPGCTPVGGACPGPDRFKRGPAQVFGSARWSTGVC
ncbi:ANTAR domain-containing protein [Streptomyces flaveolus]|uniref:ANTAR domain-containing protein n=1 Tax=Streptomyces flaveolus TaxID=67297 RepID=UPI0033AB6ACB